MAFNSKRFNLIQNFAEPPIFVDSGAASVREPYPGDTDLYKITNNLANVLQTQQELNVDEGVIQETYINSIVPTIVSNTYRQTFVEFNVPFENFVQMDKLYLSYEMDLIVNPVTNSMPYEESAYFSNLPQLAFTFMQNIKEVYTYIGARKTPIQPDVENCRDNRLWATHMQHRKVTPDEDKMRSNLGLSCTKTGAFINYANMNSASYIDGVWYPLLSGDQSSGEPRIVRKTFTIALADLVEPFDCTYLLRPNLPFVLEIYFKLPDDFTCFAGTLDPTKAYIGIANVNNPVAPESVRLYYHAKKFYPEKYELFKSMPMMVINSYHYYKLENIDLSTSGDYYVFDTWLKQRPLEILLTIISPETGIIFPANVYHAANYKVFNGGSYAGINISELRVDLTDREPLHLLNTVSNVQGIEGQEYFVSSMNACSQLLNDAADQVDANVNKFTYVPQNMNMIDNIVPLRLPLQKAWAYNRNQRQADTGTVNVRILIKFNNNFSVGPNGKVTYINGNNLPPKCKFVLLFKYPFQLLIDKETNTQVITYPNEIIRDAVTPVNPLPAHT